MNFIKIEFLNINLIFFRIKHTSQKKKRNLDSSVAP